MKYRNHVCSTFFSRFSLVYSFPQFLCISVSLYLSIFSLLVTSRRKVERNLPFSATATQFPEAAFNAVVYKLAHNNVEDGGKSEERVGRSGHVRVNIHNGRTRRARRCIARC